MYYFASNKKEALSYSKQIKWSNSTTFQRFFPHTIRRDHLSENIYRAITKEFEAPMHLVTDAVIPWPAPLAPNRTQAARKWSAGMVGHLE